MILYYYFTSHHIILYNICNYCVPKLQTWDEIEAEFSSAPCSMASLCPCPNNWHNTISRMYPLHRMHTAADGPGLHHIFVAIWPQDDTS